MVVCTVFESVVSEPPLQVKAMLPRLFTVGGDPEFTSTWNVAETSSRSRTALLTAGLNRLGAVTVVVSVTPAVPLLGIATLARREAVAPEPRATGPVSSESPASSTPLPFQSRYSVTGHPCTDTAATVKESGPLPRFVRVWANTTALPGLPLPVRGGWRLTPATCPTTRSTVSEGTTYPTLLDVKASVEIGRASCRERV